MRLDDTFRRSFTNNYGISEISSLLQQDLDDLSKRYSHCIFDRICISEELYNKTGGIRGIVHAATGNMIDVKVSFALYGLEYRICFSYDDEAKHYEDIFGVRHAVNTNPKKIWLSTASAFNDDWFSKELREKIDAAVERAKKHNDCYDVFRYCMSDVLATQEFYKQLEETMRPKLRIKNVIFNDPATIVFWFDGTKTVVKAQEGDKFDPEKGLAMAICKKILGTNGSQSNFNDIFKKWLPKEEKKEPEVIGKIKNMIMTDKGLVVEAEITDPKFSPSINEALGILGE